MKRARRQGVPATRATPRPVGITSRAAVTCCPPASGLTEEEWEALRHGFDRYSVDPGEWVKLISPTVERIVAARVAEVEVERARMESDRNRERGRADKAESDLSAARAQLEAVAALADEWDRVDVGVRDPEDEPLAIVREVRAALADPDALLAKRDAEKWAEGWQCRRAEGTRAGRPAAARDEQPLRAPGRRR